jgi:hypothetical protein
MHLCATCPCPCRLLSTFAFQGRLGIIVRTLYHIGPPLAHLLAVLVIVGVALSFMAHVVLGTCFGPMASISGALADTFCVLTCLSSIRDVDMIIPPNVEMMGVQKLAASLVLVAQTLLMTFVLLSFFFAILRATFMKHKYSYAFQYGTTLWEGLSGVILPDAWAGAQRWARKISCGILFRKRKPPLTNRQAARAVRAAALAGVDVRPQQRRVMVKAGRVESHTWTACCNTPSVYARVCA